MSMTQVKGYFRTHCKALGYKEHEDAFNWENVGETGANKVFHIEVGDVKGSRMNQPGAQASEMSMTVRLFFKPGRNVATGVDTAINESELLIKRCLKASNRCTGVIRNCSFDSMTVKPINSENDNQIISTLNFTASVLTDVEG